MVRHLLRRGCITSIVAFGLLIPGFVLAQPPDPPLLLATRVFDVGDWVWWNSTALVDFDGDGHRDLAFIRTVDEMDELAIYAGDGYGGFTEWATISIYGDVDLLAFAAGHMNGDPHLDIVLLWSQFFVFDVNFISVYLGNGQGSFQEITGFPSDTYGTSEARVVIADFNQDGHQDVVAGSGGAFVYLEGTGTGELIQDWIYVPVSGVWLEVGHFNDDPFPDLAASGGVALGDGAGGFVVQPALPITGWHVTVGDFNDDTRDDLAFTGANSVWPALGNGDGTFTVLPPIEIGDSPTFAIHTAFHDDAPHLDLVVTSNEPDYSLTVLSGDGLGGFAITEQRRTVILPFAAAVGTIDDDEFDDIAVIGNGAQVDFELTESDIYPSPAPSYPAGEWPYDLATGDFDGDGEDDDIAVANVQSDDVSIFLSDGNGGLLLRGEVPVGATPWAVDAGHLNGDQLADLVVANWEDDSISVLLNTGNGIFGSPEIIDTGDEPGDVALARIDGDLFLDLVVAVHGDDRMEVRAGDGQGGFGPATTFEAGDGPVDVSIADLDGDGARDASLALHEGEAVSVLFGDGAGGFTAPLVLPVGGPVWEHAAGFLNDDPHLDLVATHDQVTVLLGQGDRAFGPANHFDGGVGPRGLSIGDIDEDSAPDIVVASAFTSHVGAVGVLRGDGTGMLADPDFYFAGIEPLDVSPADLNRDGHTDVIVANKLDASVTVLLNALTAATGVTPQPAPSIPELAAPYPNPASRAAGGIRIPLGSALPSGSEARVFDVLGRSVTRLHVPRKGAGVTELLWNGTLADGRRAPAGTYFIRIAGPGLALSRKLTITQ